jgi:hypothetical protein
METQLLKIRKHLESGLSITPIEALNNYNCFRLGARIYDLKRIGMNIETRMITKGKKHFAEYFIPL